jgi:hypothetical protein
MPVECRFFGDRSNSSCRGVIMVLKLSPNLRQLAADKKPEEASTSGKKTAGGGLNIAKVQADCAAGNILQVFVLACCGDSKHDVPGIPSKRNMTRYMPPSRLTDVVTDYPSCRSWGWTNLRRRHQLGPMAKARRQSSARRRWSTTRWRRSSKT